MFADIAISGPIAALTYQDALVSAGIDVWDAQRQILTQCSDFIVSPHAERHHRRFRASRSRRLSDASAMTRAVLSRVAIIGFGSLRLHQFGKGDNDGRIDLAACS